MRPRLSVLLAAITLTAPQSGCGRIGFDLTVPDAAVVDATIVDSGDAATDFGPATVVPALAHPARDVDPSVTGDRLELYFASDRIAGGREHDLWLSARAAPTEPWGVPRRLDELSTAANEVTPEIAADGLTLWFARREGDTDVWVSTRPDRGAPWTTARLEPELNSAQLDFAAAPDASGRSMVLSSWRDDPARGSRCDLYLSTRPDTAAPWGVPARLSELATPDLDLDGFLTRDNRVLFFASDGRGGMGDRDIFVATRSGAAMPFGSISAVDSLNSPSQDTDPWLSRDLRYVVFASDRSGDMEIYEASR